MTPPLETIEPIRAWTFIDGVGQIHNQTYESEKAAKSDAAFYGYKVIEVMITPISPQPEGEKGFEGMVMTNLDDMIKELSSKGEDCFFAIDSTINLLKTAKHRIENLESDLAHYKQKAEEMEKENSRMRAALQHIIADECQNLDDPEDLFGCSIETVNQCKDALSSPEEHPARKAGRAAAQNLLKALEEHPEAFGPKTALSSPQVNEGEEQ